MSANTSLEFPPLRLRKFNNANVLAWILSFDKDGYARCSFQNCSFIGLDIDEMHNHYVFCYKDMILPNICDYCKGVFNSYNSVLIHKIFYHFELVPTDEILKFKSTQDDIIPKSKTGRNVSLVLKRSWEISLDKLKYIKCFVPTCLFIANSIKEMEEHYTKLCLPENREKLCYSCSVCFGRFVSAATLKSHVEKAHASSGDLAQKEVTTDNVSYWKGMLDNFSWAKCANFSCNFIDSSVGGIASHFSFCTSEKRRFLECKKCYAWLLDGQKFVLHTLDIHCPDKEKSVEFSKNFQTPVSNVNVSQSNISARKDSDNRDKYLSCDLDEESELTSLKISSNADPLSKEMCTSSVMNINTHDSRRFRKCYTKSSEGDKFNTSTNFGVPDSHASRDSSISEDTYFTQIKNIRLDDKPFTSISDIMGKIGPCMDAPLVPVDISIDRQTEWTLYVPRAPVRLDDLENLPSFEERFWGSVQMEMEDIVSKSAPYTSVRNTTIHKSVNLKKLPCSNHIPPLVSCGSVQAIDYSDSVLTRSNSNELLSDDMLDGDDYPFSDNARSSWRSSYISFNDNFHETTFLELPNHIHNDPPTKASLNMSLTTETQNGESAISSSTNSNPPNDNNGTSQRNSSQDSPESPPSSSVNIVTENYQTSSDNNGTSQRNSSQDSPQSPPSCSVNIVTENHKAPAAGLVNPVELASDNVNESQQKSTTESTTVKEEPMDISLESQSLEGDSFFEKSSSLNEDKNGQNKSPQDLTLSSLLNTQENSNFAEESSENREEEITHEEQITETKKSRRNRRKSTVVRKLKKNVNVEEEKVNAEINCSTEAVPARDNRRKRGRKRKMDSVIFPDITIDDILSNQISTPQRRSESQDSNYIVPEHMENIVENHNVLPVKLFKYGHNTRISRKRKSTLGNDVLNSLGPRITAGCKLSDPQKIVTCFTCKEKMTAETYQKKHLLKHTFICWLEEEVPLPLDDYPAMTLYLNRCKKVFPKAHLACTKCSAVKKSAVGFISHYQFCGKTCEEMNYLKTVCPVCQRMFKPSNIDQHLVTNHSVRTDIPVDNFERPKYSRKSATRATETVFKTITEEDEEILPLDLVDTNMASAPPPEDYSVLRKKWKDALAKENIIICPYEGCGFAAGSLSEMRKHYRSCSASGSLQPFACKECSFKASTRDALKVHVKKVHSESQSAPTPPAEIVYPIPALKEIEDELYSSFSFLRQASFFRPAMQWTFELREAMLSKDKLFPNIQVDINNWISIDDPTPYSHSLKESVMMKYESSEWDRLTLYGTLSEAGSSCFFSGGPVWAMAWVPTPDGVLKEQILTVSNKLQPGQSKVIGQIYKDPSTIQLWSFGLLLNNRTRETREVEPALKYSLCVEGCAWDLSWCPSGCYDDNRLGVLAAALSSGEVHVFALPHNKQLPKKEVPLYRYKPDFKLLPRAQEMSQCKRVGWSKVRPHNIIVGGFANGMVAVWNLNVGSTLLRQGTTLYPCIYFKAHHAIVTSVSMCPISNNFLLTASMDRNVRLWDLRATDNPLQTVNKGTYTDADWLSHWGAYVSAVDGGYVNATSTGLCSSVRDFSFITSQVLNSYATTSMSVSTSDWLNAAAFSLEDGNVVGMFGIRQMGSGTESTKKRTKYIVQCKLTRLAKAETKRTLLKKTASTSNDIPTDSSNYEETASMFGLHFSLSRRVEDCLKNMKSPEDCRYDVYSIQCANKVCFNPNMQSFLSLAVGYESGFVIVPSLLLPSNASELIKCFLPESDS